MAGAAVRAPVPRRAGATGDVDFLVEAERSGALHAALLHDYYRYRLFGRENDIVRLLAEAKKGWSGQRMRRREESMVGSEVGDQVKIRPRAPARDLDEYLEFLARLEALFGPIERTPQPTTGDRFLL